MLIVAVKVQLISGHAQNADKYINNIRSGTKDKHDS